MHLAKRIGKNVRIWGMKRIEERKKKGANDASVPGIIKRI
jgi:hypothetical protein